MLYFYRFFSVFKTIFQIVMQGSQLTLSRQTSFYYTDGMSFFCLD